MTRRPFVVDWDGEVVELSRGLDGLIQVRVRPRHVTGPRVFDLSHMAVQRLSRPISSPDIFTPSSRDMIKKAGYSLDEPLGTFVQRSKEEVLMRLRETIGKKFLEEGDKLLVELRSHGLTLGLDISYYWTTPVVTVSVDDRPAVPEHGQIEHASDGHEGPHLKVVN